MSAWIVSKGHVDYVVSAMKFNKYERFTVWHDGRRHDLTDTEWGKVLWSENLRSVACRYPGEEPHELPGPNGFKGDPTIAKYRFAERPGVTRVGAYKALGSLEYQSCEHPGWEASLARAYCEQLRDACVTSMPEYDAADTWSI